MCESDAEEITVGYLERYVAEETAAEYTTGRITYRELLRRFTLLTGSAVSALALAVTLGCTSDEASVPTVPLPASTATAAPT
ncbi:MAG: hypothetical protein HY330_02350, partial [Chloroflexi bacterium]|nr:hypothetical protein [Chloroflexota bacterium]